MRRRSFMTRAGAVLTAGALASPAIAQENPKLQWKMASSFPKSLDTIYGGINDIALHLAAATDGNFTIDVVDPGDAGESEASLLNSVRAGTVDALHTCSYYFLTTDPTYAIGTALPFGLNARLSNAWLFEGGGNALLNDFYATQGLYALPAGNTGAQMGGWFRKEINTLDDLKGVKMRIAGLGGQIISKLGVAIDQLAGNDIYSAFEKGTIDAAEFVGPYDDLKLGLQKISKFYYYPGWWEGATVVHAFFNLQKWASLPKRYQACLSDACAFANMNMLAKYDQKNPQALKQLAGGDVSLRPFSQDIMDAAFQASQAVFRELSTSNQSFKKIYDHQIAFRRDAYLWMQLSEYTFDTYMMIQQRAGKL
ncbi:TRAP transporter substrate-binding protein [Oryzifoliimicrobium ureilyticus]|uniref:TRAP transporter substrate-binding protein n=1 Tax=Oryzifoliimicrobium ureilyticus TaxID=3113724 RepID=UPI00307622D9